ncbi:MAG: orotate phosphoribosyltransferase [Chloroflexota bacterium]|nr:orotate phosphoribosyltransferase [Chloroflexota bacterium]
MTGANLSPTSQPPADLSAMRDELRHLLARFAVRHGTFTLSSGETSDLYVDCRVVATLPRAMRCIGALMLDLLRDLPDVRGVGGLAIGADPIAAAVAMSSLEGDREIPMFMVRKEPKGHGLRRRIEGAFPEQSGASVVVVDDVITKGGSVLQAIEAVETETEARVARAVLIVDRLEGGAEMLRQKGYDVRSIFTRHDFTPA